MNIHIRPEAPEDYRAVEELTREAFWGCMTHPTCDGEHLIVHKLRRLPCFVPALNFVAERGGTLAGHIIYSLAKVVTPAGGELEVLTFGPLSVLPQYKKTGIGSALMHHSIAAARTLGYRAIIFYGHPDYYPRFGFERASSFGITSQDGKSFDALMAMPLYDGALDECAGRFIEDPAFRIDPAELSEFDRGFPEKEPATLPPIELLLERLPPKSAAELRRRDLKVLARLQDFSGAEIARWSGVDRQAMAVINAALSECGYPPKLFPQSV